MATKSRESIYGASVRAAAEQAAEARKIADRLACEAWNKRMLGFQGPAQPSPALGDALNAGYLYLEVRCLGCDPAEVDADPRTRAIHALQELLGAERSPLETQPSRRSENEQDQRDEPAVYVV